jgi:lipoprotein-releasing system permease protein
MNFEWMIAVRYLRARRRQVFISVITLISILGVMVGVAALIVVLGVMVGAQEDIKEKILGANSHLTVLSYHDRIDNYKDAVKKIEQVPEVVAASPYLESQVMLFFNSRVGGAVVRGVDPDSAVKVTTIGAKMISGNFNYLKTGAFLGEGEDLPGIAVGRDLAMTIGAGYGDVVSVVSPTGSLGPMGLAPSSRKFRVVAVFSFGFYEVDSGFVFISLPEAQKFMHLGEQADGIEVKLKDLYLADKKGKEIEKALGGFPYWARTWTEAHGPLFAALKVEQMAFSIILALIVMVAGLNIISTLVMMVMEKYRDIAILKSMGATDREVMKIFMYQGLVIGVIGTLLGAALGSFLCWLQIKYQIISLDPTVYQFAVMPMVLRWQYVLAVSGFAILISFLSTLYPARQAAKMNPAESLRYE